MVGLIDCNNFFVSCEKVFNPSLQDKLVIVLSNNDGCVVSMSNEAKLLGIKRGVSVGQIQSLIDDYDIKVYSSNFKLYGDMSARVMTVLMSIVPNIEIYSIDEAFIDFSGIPKHNLEKIGRDIVKKIRRFTGIPTSLGIAKTKTLAKLASKKAKENIDCKGVFIIEEDNCRDILEKTLIQHVWGIGKKLSEKLIKIGIINANAFIQHPYESYSDILNIQGIKIWKELRGIHSIELESDDIDKKQISSSRTFSEPLVSKTELFGFFSLFAERICRKLNNQNCSAVSVSIYLYQNLKNDNKWTNANSSYYKFEEPISDIVTLTSMVLKMVESIYVEGVEYKKAGIIVPEIIDSHHVQNNLFYSHQQREKRKKLMNSLSYLNQNCQTKDIVRVASNVSQQLPTKSDYLSRLYTTHFDQLITVKCN